MALIKCHKCGKIPIFAIAYGFFIAFISVISISNAFAGNDNSQASVFGIALHKPLDIPECEKTENGGSQLIGEKRMCVISGRTRTDVCRQNVEIFFPDNLKPYYFKMMSIYVVLIEDNVESVEFPTLGESVQKEVLADLKTKYGKPSKIRSVPYKDIFGRKFSGTEANWKKQNFSVSFIGIIDEIDDGGVSVYTDIYENNLSACKATKSKMPL